MKIEIKGWIHASTFDKYENGEFRKAVSHHFYQWEKSYGDSKSICEFTLVADVPVVDPITLEVEVLQAKRAEIVAESLAKMQNIDQQLEKLLALTNEVKS